MPIYNINSGPRGYFQGKLPCTSQPQYAINADSTIVGPLPTVLIPAGADNKSLLLTTLPTLAATSDGLAWSTSGSSAFRVTTLGSVVPLTVVCRFYIPSGATGVIASYATTGDQASRLTLEYNGTNLRFRWQVNNEYTTDVAGLVLDRWNTAVFVIAATDNRRAYVNGVLAGTDTRGSTLLQGPLTKIAVLCDSHYWANTGTSGLTSGMVSLYGICNLGFSDPLARSVSSNPWSLFANDY